MTGWNAENDDAVSAEEAVVMLLAGPPSRVNAWFTSLQMDSRFRVNTFSTDPQDLENKMGYNPEAILLDATIFSGPENLTNFLTKTTSAVYVVLPREAGDDVRKSLSDLPSVRGVFINDINLSQMAGRIYAEVIAPAQPGTPQWGRLAKAIAQNALLAGCASLQYGAAQVAAVKAPLQPL